MSETQTLATWSCELDSSSIPPHSLIKAKQCLLEFLSCCLAARNEEPARLLIRTLKQLGSASQASIIGHPLKLPMDQAAWSTGPSVTSGRSDDTHRHTMSHPGESIIPAALAVSDAWETETGQASSPPSSRDMRWRSGFAMRCPLLIWREDGIPQGPRIPLGRQPRQENSWDLIRSKRRGLSACLPPRLQVLFAISRNGP